MWLRDRGLRSHVQAAVSPAYAAARCLSCTRERAHARVAPTCEGCSSTACGSRCSRSCSAMTDQLPGEPNSPLASTMRCVGPAGGWPGAGPGDPAAWGETGGGVAPLCGAVGGARRVPPAVPGRVRPGCGWNGLRWEATGAGGGENGGGGRMTCGWSVVGGAGVASKGESWRRLRGRSARTAAATACTAESARWTSLARHASSFWSCREAAALAAAAAAEAAAAACAASLAGSGWAASWGRAETAATGASSGGAVGWGCSR